MIDILIELIAAALQGKEDKKRPQRGPRPIPRRPGPGARPGGQPQRRQPAAENDQPTLQDIIRAHRERMLGEENNEWHDPHEEPYQPPMAANLQPEEMPSMPPEPERQGYGMASPPERTPGTFEAQIGKQADLDSIRTDLRDHKAVRRAFILNEILQPPVSLREEN